MSQIVLLKLKTGEELIAKVVDNGDEDAIEIDEPRIIAVQPTQNGASFGLAPWLPWILGSGNPIRIEKQDLLLDPIEDLPKDIEDGYLQQTSGIQI